MMILNDRLKRLSMDETHCIVIASIVPRSHRIDRHNTWMLQTPGDLCFSDEPLACLLMRAPFGSNLFDRYFAFELAVIGNEDFAKSTLLVLGKNLKSGVLDRRRAVRRRTKGRGIRFADLAKAQQLSIGDEHRFQKRNSNTCIILFN